MNLRQTGELLAYLSAFDGRHFNEYTAGVWHEVIGEYTLTECKNAAKEHYSESSSWLMPAHITAKITETRRERLRAIGTVPRVNQADETRSDAHYLLKRIAKAVASGELSRTDYENYLKSNTPFEQTMKEIQR